MRRSLKRKSQRAAASKRTSALVTHWIHTLGLSLLQRLQRLLRLHPACGTVAREGPPRCTGFSAYVQAAASWRAGSCRLYTAGRPPDNHFVS